MVIDKEKIEKERKENFARKFQAKKIRAKAMFRTWSEPLSDLLSSEYMQNLHTFLENKYYTSTLIRPSLNRIYMPFRYCPWDDVKMVMVTSIHYHQENSNGLGCGVQKGTKDFPYILESIRKNIEKTFYPNIQAPLFDETMEDLAKQGVLMLNASLTTQASEDHAVIWKNFIREVISTISKEKEKVAFIFLSDSCNHFESYVDKTKHKVFKNEGFTLDINSRVFHEADEYIYDEYDRKDQIIW